MARSSNTAASKAALKTETAPAASAAPATPEVTPEVTDAAPAVVVDAKPAEVTDDVNFDVVQQKFAALIVAAKELQTYIKVIQKAYTKLSKTKAKRSNKGAGGNATPSGFVKPAPLSDALAAFLGLDNGASLPRTEVTKRVNEYVKSNNLQNPSDRRTILPDAKLKALLNPGQDDNVTYFNLQRYLKPHFIKVTA